MKYVLAIDNRSHAALLVCAPEPSDLAPAYVRKLVFDEWDCMTEDEMRDVEIHILDQFDAVLRLK
jgi:hypothetical protein